MYQHDQIPELVIVSNRSKSRIVSHIFETEVIVDAVCGTAVLRGAHVFAPGVLGISKGTNISQSSWTENGFYFRRNSVKISLHEKYSDVY